jgi:hypothetical protein
MDLVRAIKERQGRARIFTRRALSRFFKDVPAACDEIT